jgi:hemoglobin
MNRTIFERYGGFSNVSRVVSGFYDKVLDSPVISHYFEQTDMRRLIDHQTRFIAMLMGGPASYTDDHLARVHDHMNITESAFTEVCMLLRDTLEEQDYDDEDIHTVLDAMMARKHVIVSRRG